MLKAKWSKSVISSVICAAALGTIASLPGNGVLAQEADADDLNLSDQTIEQTAQGVVVPSKRTTIRRGETVQSRPRPELDPLGGRIGSFLVFPSFAIQEDYDSNIFATSTDREDDFITHLEPGLFVESDWGRHSLSFGGEADVALHADNTSENYEDYFLGADGTLEVGSGGALDAFIDYDHRHVPRSSPNDIVQGTIPTEPIEFDVFGFGGGYTQEFNRFRVRPEISYQIFDYSGSDLVGGGFDNNDDRNRDILNISLRGDYAFSPGYSAFVRGSFNDRNYKESINPGGVNRDSDGYEIVAGLSADLGGLVFGEIFAGYVAQDFSDGDLDNISDPTVGADVTWNVTPLTTIEGTVSRTVEETVVTEGADIASSNFVTAIGLSVDHELLRNLLIGANVGVEIDDFEGISREDQIYNAGVNATYMLNRYLHASAGYEYFRRNSNVVDTGYTDNLFFVRLLVQY
ncbi:MAG: outer membrane beta-barrel protein [Pseudomonadota bacterium]